MWPSLVGKTWHLQNEAAVALCSRMRRFAGNPVLPPTRKSQQWSERPFYTPCHLGRRGLQIAGSAVGRPVEVHAFADRIVIRQDGRIVAEHPRSFGRGETIYDPWHYVPVLARKPGALRNGAPFKDWVLPAAMERVRRKLTGVDDGNRQMVDILNAVLTDGLPAVEAACAEAIAHGVHSADVVLNILARQRDPGPAVTILTPAALTLRHAPVADCARYDNLRRTI